MSSVLYDSGHLNTYKDMMSTIFLWTVISTVLLHLFAAFYSFYAWRKHSVGRWYFLLLLVLGIGGSLVYGSITSAVLSGVFVSLGWKMTYIIALIIGIGHTVIGFCISFTRFPSTL